jgi:hypothetical protein
VKPQWRDTEDERKSMSRNDPESTAKLPRPNPRSVDRALSQLQDIVLRGLEHGFFECSVSGEIIPGGKRRLLIKAGHSFQFVIAADELDRNGRS